jgi:translation initiation factor 1
MKKTRNDGEDSIVWSSDPSPAGPRDVPLPGPARTLPARAGAVLVSRQSKGRRGKTVTEIRGLGLAPEALDDLARDLKQHCGTGGTVRGEVIELQGDQRDAVVTELGRRGWTVKRAGG